MGCRCEVNHRTDNNGARMLLKQRGFHEAKIYRALGVLQHHRDFDDELGRPHMFARIIRSTLIAQPTAVSEMDTLTELFETKAKPGVIKGHELRHLLTGVRTSSRTELSSREADVLFDQLGIEEDGDVFRIRHDVRRIRAWNNRRRQCGF